MVRLYITFSETLRRLSKTCTLSINGYCLCILSCKSNLNPLTELRPFLRFVQRHGAGLEILSLGESKVRGSGQKDMQRENEGEREGDCFINRRCFYDTLVSIA